MLNLIDALSALNISFGEDLIQAILNRLNFDTDQEIISRVCGLLAEKGSTNIFDNLIRSFYQSDENKKLQILPVMKRIAGGAHISSDIGLSEFLYRVLREDDIKCIVQAATFLYSLGDDYSLKILDDLLKKVSHEGKVQIIRDLHGSIKPDVIPLIKDLLYEESTSLQESLCETLLSVEDPDLRCMIIEHMFRNRQEPVSDDDIDNPEAEAALHIDFSRQKKAYKFEKENIEKCAVFFTDIKGYTKRSQELSSLELATLIQEYEGMLLPIISSHEGTLIKRMGDGHLFIFHKPLNAALAGIRLQKALKRYNSYQEERYRINIRVGIHWGDVVRKEDDVLGTTVNTASRLETSAKEGTVYISHELYEFVKKYVHSREIGPIQVKGIEKAIMVFEPYESAFDLPEELDPLKRKGIGHKDRIQSKVTENNEKEQGLVQSDSGVAGINRKFLHYLKDSFISLNNICVKVENGEAQAFDIRKELSRRWKVLIYALKNEGS